MKNRRIRFHIGKKYYMGFRTNIFLMLWILIIFGSVYLLVRFAVLSFSEEMGQAELSYRNAFMYYISNKVMESGSSLVSYTVHEEEAAASFPLKLIKKQFILPGFIEDKALLLSKAREYAPDKNYVNRDEEEPSKAVEEAMETVETNASYQTDTGISDKAGTGDNKEGNNSDGEYKEQPGQFSIKHGIGFYKVSESILNKEYILTNGKFYNAQQAAYLENTNAGDTGGNRLEIDSLEGNVDSQETDKEALENAGAMEASNPGNVVEYTMEQLKDINFLLRNFYIVDSLTKATESLFDAEQLLGKDMTIKQGNDAPQILIYHTHSQEAYIDSRENEGADTVVGVGTYLTQLLEDEYGYQVIHDTAKYDIINGKLNRNRAYNMAEEGVQKILDKNPTIEVIIDLHRDGGDKRSTVVNGKEAAQVMLFNGLSRDQNGPITYLENPYILDNLALSLQLQMKAIEIYPGLFYKNYLKCYRYNLHLRPKSMLVELGTDKNTLQSAKNAMEPFAEILNAVLQGE